MHMGSTKSLVPLCALHCITCNSIWFFSHFCDTCVRHTPHWLYKNSICHMYYTWFLSCIIMYNYILYYIQYTYSCHMLCLYAWIYPTHPLGAGRNLQSGPPLESAAPPRPGSTSTRSDRATKWPGRWYHSLGDSSIRRWQTNSHWMLEKTAIYLTFVSDISWLFNDFSND